MIVLTRQVTSIRKKDPDLKEGDFWVEEELPVDINKLQGIVEDSAIAQLPYDLNWDRVREAETSLNRSSVNAPGGQGLRLTRHQPESGIFHMLMDMKSREDAEVKDKLFKGLRLSPSGVLFDETTGLSALMVRSRNDNQLKVHNFLVENDPVNTPKGYKLFHKQFKLGLIGKRTIIKGQKETGKNSLYGRHSWSHLHYVAAVKKRYRQLPEPQKPFPNRPFDKE
ncbi:hypothetical protein [Endozoicomonas sp. Mp262]|uniref:hypothetical protein n=1 Tax=Endozoicomonas sp. Mp262 TaxID=2919499 RepID=UPI0021D9F8F8